MVTLVTGENPAIAWVKLVRKIVKDGEEVLDERGQKTLELMNVVTEIQNPYSKLHPKGTFWTGEKLHAYEEQFFNPNNDQGFVYTYGCRLRGHFAKKDVDSDANIYNCYTYDQLEGIIHRLEQCKESRRAIGVTWDPTIDMDSEEVPCLMLMDYKVRNHKLQVTALWRSHDIYGAYYPNIRGLIYTSKYISKQLKIELGKITTHSISAHIYETDLEEAKKV